METVPTVLSFPDFTRLDAAMMRELVENFGPDDPLTLSRTEGRTLARMCGECLGSPSREYCVGISEEETHLDEEGRIIPGRELLARLKPELIARGFAVVDHDEDDWDSQFTVKLKSGGRKVAPATSLDLPPLQDLSAESLLAAVKYRDHLLKQGMDLDSLERLALMSIWSTGLEGFETGSVFDLYWKGPKKRPRLFTLGDPPLDLMRRLRKRLLERGFHVPLSKQKRPIERALSLYVDWGMEPPHVGDQVDS